MAEQEPRQGSSTLHDLLARCALRDRAAFAALYEATAPNLFGIALRILRTRHWAEEVLQEAFLKIWNHAPSYDPNRGAPMTWMINIVRNQALDLKRRADVRAESNAIPVDEDLPDKSDDPSEAAAAHTALGRLRGCLERLAADQRACLLLAYHEGYSPAEIARKKALPLGTVKTWVRRGLMRVRECMQI
jgi:RNA polymerase sigma-70 factor (ECF subfamily)